MEDEGRKMFRGGCHHGSNRLPDITIRYNLVRVKRLIAKQL